MKASDSSNSSVRKDPYTTQFRVQHPLPKGQTPEAALGRWEDQLVKMKLGDDLPYMRDVFERIAFGRANLGSRDEMLVHDTFHDLITGEAFDLFAELFTAYNEIERAHAMAMGKPFCSTLTLALPQDWEPSPEKQREMLDAFRRIRVGRLELMCPRVSLDALSDADDGPFPDSDDHGWEKVAAERNDASTTVADAIVALLSQREDGGAGVTELVVLTDLPAPEVIAKALPSSRLKTLELCMNVAKMGDRLKATCETLLKGVATCLTLENLGLHHRDLIAFHPLIQSFNGPELVSVKVLGATIEVEDLPAVPQLVADPLDENAKQVVHPLVSFMTTIARFETLSEVAVNATFNSLNDVSVSIFRPLKACTALHRLEIGLAEGDEYFDIDTSDALLELAEFAVECPALTHFAWNIGDFDLVPSDETSYSSKWANRAQEKAGDLLVLEQRLRSKDFKLTSLRLTGARLPPQDLETLVDAMVEKETPDGRKLDALKLEELHLKCGFMDMKLTHRLPELLKNNVWLKTLVLPAEIERYYLVVAKDVSRIQLWEAQARRQATNKASSLIIFSFILNLAETMSEGDWGLVLTLAKMLGGGDATELTSAPQKQLDRNQRRLLAHVAYGELGVDMAKMLSTSPNVGPHFPGDVGRVIVEHLGEERRLRDVVHLAEVNTTTDHRSLRNPGNSRSQAVPAEVQSLVTMDNRYAARKELPDAPSKANKVDDRGRNKALAKAAAQGDAQRVRSLRQNGNAIDFRGGAEAVATTQAVAEALREPVELRTTTTASTMATTLTTSTTTAPTTAVQQERVPDPARDPSQS